MKKIPSHIKGISNLPTSQQKYKGLTSVKSYCKIGIILTKYCGI